jgi:hypothetical protein
MTAMPLVALALLAIPVVLLFATAGCGLGPIGTPLPDAPPSAPADPGPGQQPVPHGPVPTPTPAAHPTYSELVLSRPSLIGYWRLDEPKTIFAALNPTAIDSHPPNNFAGNYINNAGITLQQTGALPHDPDNNAASFLGGYVEVPYSGQLTPAALTVELWMSLGKTLSNWQVLVGCYDPQPLIDTFLRGYRVRANTELKAGTWVINIDAHLGGMSTAMALGAEFPFVAGHWHHIVLQYDPAVPGAQLFVDGDAVRTPGGRSLGKYDVVAGAGRPLRFAADQQLLLLTYSGLLDEIALYGDCLTPGDIHDHFAAATT